MNENKNAEIRTAVKEALRESENARDPRMAEARAAVKEALHGENQ